MQIYQKYIVLAITASVISISAYWAIKKSLNFANKAIFYPPNKNYRPFLSGFFAIAASIVIIVLTIAIVLAALDVEGGQFGDFFGGLTNPLLTFLTIVGLLITIVMQQDSTKEARELATRQMFDSSFFQMLTLLNTMVNEFEILDDNGKRISKGKDSFRCIYRSLDDNYRAKWDGSELKKIGESYSTVYGIYSGILPHYFRFVFNILRTVDDSPLNDIEKRNYIRLLRAQLSNHETGIIFYNSLMSSGKKFNLFIKRYNLLDNFPQKTYLNSSHPMLLDERPFQLDID
jgi:Putative phage abortive infection protein